MRSGFSWPDYDARVTVGCRSLRPTFRAIGDDTERFVEPYLALAAPFRLTFEKRWR